MVEAGLALVAGVVAVADGDLVVGDAEVGAGAVGGLGGPARRRQVAEAGDGLRGATAGVPVGRARFVGTAAAAPAGDGDHGEHDQGGDPAQTLHSCKHEG